MTRRPCDAAVRAIPKVELHRHLEGSVRPGTYLELAREAGLKRRSASAIRVAPGDPRSLRSFLSKFAPLRDVYASEDAIRRVAREAVEDAAADGVEYLELRFSPVYFARRMGLHATRTAEWIVDSARREAGRRRMTVNFLVTVSRDFPAGANEPSVLAACSLRPAFVGLDVAGDEASPLDHLAPLIRRARRAGLRLTLHAGESGPPERSVAALRRYGPERIGHGVRLPAIPPGTAVEACPTSNLQTGAWCHAASHPLRRWFDAAIPVSLNTDDPAISGISLVDEYRLAARSLGFTAEEFRELNRRARASAFE